MITHKNYVRIMYSIYVLIMIGIAYIAVIYNKDFEFENFIITIIPMLVSLGIVLKKPETIYRNNGLDDDFKQLWIFMMAFPIFGIFVLIFSILFYIIAFLFFIHGKFYDKYVIKEER